MDPGIEYLIQTQSVDSILARPPAATTIKRVDFARVILPESIDTELYEIMLASDMGARNVVALFPGNARCPVVWSSAFGSLHSWNKALNDALSNSLDETEDSTDGKLCIAHGKHIYACRKFSGNLYMFWATVRHGSRGLLGTQMPVLINTDGKLVMRAVMILRPVVNEPGDAERIPLTVESPKLMWNWKTMGGHPFVCDVHLMTPVPAPLMLSETQARYQLTCSTAAASAADLLHVKPLLGHNQFEHSVDREDLDDSGVTVEMESASEHDVELMLRREK